MPVFVKNRVGRTAKSGSAKQPAAMPSFARPLAGHPIHRGAAVRAKMKADLESGIGKARIDLALSLDSHLVLREIHAEVNYRAGSTLT